jgi:hypothetical protein
MTHFNGDPVWAQECAEFHRALKAELERRHGVQQNWRDDLCAWVEAAVAFDRAVHAEAGRVRPPVDIVPATEKTDPVPWEEVRRRAHGRPLRFHTVEITETGVRTISQPVALGVPDWPDDPRGA